MDREKLESILNTNFKAECSNKGYPLDEICLSEAYPGVEGTSFTINIDALWARNMECSSALDILIDCLWDSVSVEFRKMIFSINIYTEGELHCQGSEHIMESILDQSLV